MRIALPIALVALTAVFITISLFAGGHSRATEEVDGAALFAFEPAANTPEQAVANLMHDVQRKQWDQAFATLSRTSGIDQKNFVEDLNGSPGSLRSFSVLESFEPRPLHITSDSADIRLHLHWATPVGPIEDVRDLHLIKDGNIWQPVWPKQQFSTVPAQVVPVTYLRWDLVSGGSDDNWGARNVDSPRVRITSMTAVETAEGAVVMGELVNEDTIPAFVNVNATLVDAAGNAIDEESSFDKVAHVLLPKQVTPYRIDFPDVTLKNVKSVRMDEKATLVPASADPVIGVMNQKVETDASGKAVLRGDLTNESGTTVNIPHVIASFYDSNGKVIWVSDGYVERSLQPQSSESFAVEIPRTIASKVQNFHVVVNQYSIAGS
jgi:hypothetical protein